MAYVRTVRTASGARAVQIVHGSRTIEHVGSAYDDAELEALKAAARQRLAGGQAELDLGLEPSIGVVSPGGLSPGPSGRPLEMPPRGWGRCGTGCVAPTTRSGSTWLSVGMRCSISWCWRQMFSSSTAPSR